MKQRSEGHDPRDEGVPLAELIAGLSDPRAYEQDVARVDVLQTHVSVLFFAGPRVYKLKKPVDLGFLDFTTPQARRRDGELELTLNRRLSPEMYLGLVPVTRRDDGSLRMGGDGPPLEWAVEMLRLPAAGMLDRLLATGRIDGARIEALAKLLADFHAQAATGEGVDEFGRSPAVSELVLGNLAGLAPFTGDGPGATLSDRLAGFLARGARRFVSEHEELLARRVAQGRIRDGHGDLHAGNICCVDDRIVVYDCLEFSRAFRCADVAADLAFLAMDMDYRGFRAFSRDLVRRYVARTGDVELGTLLDFYKTHRACVRGKVASLLAVDAVIDEAGREAARRRARGYFHLAASYGLPPVLVVMCGLPATGKSWLARALARPFEARVLRSDVVRKRMVGLPPSTHVTGDAAASLYSTERTDAVYAALLHDALAEVSHGRSVVVDATFTAERHRRRFVDAATRLEHPVVVVQVTCPEEEVRRRMALRIHDRAEASDADWDVYVAARDRFEPPDEQTPERRVVVESGEPVQLAVARLVDRLVGQVDPES